MNTSLRHTKHLLSVGMLTVMAAAFFSCTILDNDLRDLPDTPGFKELVHIESEEYTLDYQYLPETMVFDDKLIDYVAEVDYTNHTLYLHQFTPDKYIPEVGRTIHAAAYDEIPYGLNHRVTAVSKAGEFYAVSLERVALDEVFQELKIDGNFEIIGEYQEEILDSTEFQLDEALDSKMRHAPIANYDKEIANEWTEFDLIVLVNTFTHGMTTKAEYGPFSGSFNLTGTASLKWRPILMARTYIDLSEEKFDLNTSVGVEFEFTPIASGTINGTLDVLKALKLSEVLKKTIPIVPTAGISLKIEPTLNLNLSLSGSTGTKFSKKVYTTFGGRYNINNASDGGYVENHTGKMNILPPEETNVESLVFPTDLSLSLMGGLDVSLLFGAPTEYPNIGLKVGASIGPKVATQILLPTNDDFDKGLKTSIAAKFTGSIFLNIFKFLSVDWNLIDLITKKMGLKEGAEVDIPSTVAKYRFYPSIDDMTIYCKNPNESDKNPEFNLSFNVKEVGLKYSNKRYIKPIIRIYPADFSGEPLLSKNDCNYIYKDKLNNFNWTFSSDKLKRDTYYDAEVVMCKLKTSGELEEIASKRFKFTSTSPTLTITNSYITAQKESRSLKINNKTNQYDCKYDWTFRTDATVTGLKDILKWGFESNGKNYEKEGAPPSENLVLKWQLTGSNKRERTYNITPYVVYKLGDYEYKGYMPPYTVKLTYDPELNDEFSKDTKYEYSWFDIDEDYGQPNVTWTKSRLPQQVDQIPDGEQYHEDSEKSTQFTIDDDCILELIAVASRE